MNYIQEKCLFQTIIVSEILKMESEEVLSKIGKYYPLNKDENEAIEKLVSDTTFNRLTTSNAVQLHLNFVKAFCKAPNTFGVNIEENRALEIKLAALTLAKSVSNTGEVFETLGKHAETNDRLTVSLAFMYILSDCDTKLYLPLLRRAEAHDYPEAAIVLMGIEPERRQNLYEKLEINKELYLLRDNTVDSIATYYRIKKSLEE